MFDLTGRVALVTGAGRNIGRGIAHALADAGAAVAVNDIDGEAGAAVAAEIADAGGRACSVEFDVTKADQVAEGVDAAEAELGAVDVLVNNAGVPRSMGLAQFIEMTPDQWRSPAEINMFGSMNCCRAVLDSMLERQFGRIIQISSGSGQSGLRIGVSAYGASKSGVEGFIRHLSQEVARQGITANSLALGLMGADDGDSPSDHLTQIARQIPVGRLGRPADVGAAVVYLASNEAAWVTGQTININGGQVTT